MKSVSRGLTAAVISAVMFGIVPIFTKLSVQDGLPSLNATAIRLLLISLFSALIACIRRAKFRVGKKNLLRIALLTVFYGATLLTLAMSYDRIPIGIATMCHFSYPVFIAIGMLVFFCERLTACKSLAILISFGSLCLSTQN